MIQYILMAVWTWITSWVWGWGGIGAVIAAAAWVLWYFTPPFLSSSKRDILWVAIGATAITIGSSYFFTSGYHQGWSAAFHAVALKDQKAIKESFDATKDVTDCLAIGGNWSVSDGLCQRPAN